MKRYETITWADLLYLIDNLQGTSCKDCPLHSYCGGGCLDAVRLYLSEDLPEEGKEEDRRHE